MKKLSGFSKNNHHPNSYQKPRPTASVRERAQALILVAIIFVVLLAFVGLVTDIGSIYMTWTQLKRAVDAASVAAANNMKTSVEGLTEQQRKIYMTEAARETLALNNVRDITELVVLNCDDLDADPPIVPADHILRRMCPTAQGMRKLAWVEARQDVPVYFLAILGVRSYPLILDSIGEAAVLDLVLVFDTSESMGNLTPGFSENDFNPVPCNAANNCQPLSDAKDAAKKLVNRLYSGYDRVALVTFDYKATLILPFTDNIGLINSTIDSGIQLHDDAPRAWFAWDTQYCPSCEGRYNPVFPDDRDGDGLDADADDCVPHDDSYNFKYRIDLNTYFPNDPNYDMNEDPNPCDEDSRLDVYNWDHDPDYDPDNPTDQHIYDDPSDPDVAELQSLYPNDLDSVYNRTTIVDTCIGCGIRMGTEQLVNTGRPGGVWVMVFLTDGVANLSDNPHNWQAIPPGGGLGIPSNLHTGYCTENFWGMTDTMCRDQDPTPRYCVDEASGTCPPDTTFTSPTSGLYSPVDYAYDRIDDGGLLYPTNADEPIGADIVLYSIIFGTDSDLPLGLPLMHYMADVGDDGARGGPCEDITNVATQCGNYYYAENTVVLERVFEDIAARIFTKISR